MRSVFGSVQQADSCSLLWHRSGYPKEFPILSPTPSRPMPSHLGLFLLLPNRVRLVFLEVCLRFNEV